jgi:hypothetical protein
MSLSLIRLAEIRSEVYSKVVPVILLTQSYGGAANRPLGGHRGPSRHGSSGYTDTQIRLIALGWIM